MVQDVGNCEQEEDKDEITGYEDESGSNFEKIKKCSVWYNAVVHIIGNKCSSSSEDRSLNTNKVCAFF